MAAKSFTQLKQLFKDLTMNQSPSNDTLAGTLINLGHSYLLQKYFDNERVTSITTVGPQSLTLSTVANVGATSATLASPANWPYLSTYQLCQFSDGEQRRVNFTQNSNIISWAGGLADAQTTTTLTTSGVATYPLPAQVSKLKNTTINVGQLVYTAAPVVSIQQWTQLNALPYSAEIVAYFFVYQGFINFWPIPSNTGDVVDIYYQLKVADMSFSDMTVGNVTNATPGNNVVIGSGTTWGSFGNFNTDLIDENLHMVINPPAGDGRPYLIQSFSSATQANLYKPIAYAPGMPATASYTIGQYPLLFGDFSDILVYWALLTYYSSIGKDPDRYALYEKIYNEKKELMEGYLSTKSVNVDLDAGSLQIAQNPNLFPMATLQNL